MMNQMMGSGMMWGMALLWLLVVVVLCSAQPHWSNTCFSAGSHRPQTVL